MADGTSLSSQVVSRASAVRAAPRPSGRGLLVTLIPAHNEEGTIEEAIRHLHEQASPPDLLVVCADNCTDGTARTAEAAGAHVFTLALLHLGYKPISPKVPASPPESWSHGAASTGRGCGGSAERSTTSATTG